MTHTSFNKMQTLKEELELVRSEKDQLSASMKDVIQGAESYKVRIVLHSQKTDSKLSVNTLGWKPSLGTHCCLLAQLCLAKEIVLVQLNTRIKKWKVLLRASCSCCLQHAEENETLSFYWNAIFKPFE